MGLICATIYSLPHLLFWALCRDLGGDFGLSISPASWPCGDAEGSIVAVLSALRDKGAIWQSRRCIWSYREASGILKGRQIALVNATRC